MAFTFDGRTRMQLPFDGITAHMLLFSVPFLRPAWLGYKTSMEILEESFVSWPPALVV
jgi:hypothetical protein